MTLSDEARQVIESARVAYAPRAHDHARIKRALAVQIAIGASAATGVAAGSSLASLVASKAAVVGIVASAAVGTTVAVGVWHAHREAAETKTTVTARLTKPSDVTRSSSRPASGASAAPVSAPFAEPSAAAAAGLEPTTKPPLTPEATKPSASTRAPSTSSASTTPARGVEAEAELLGDAQRALADGNARRALVLLDEHAREFPHGALAEERQAARIVALCALGRTAQAQREARAFLARTPNSPLAIRVRAACRTQVGSP